MLFLAFTLASLSPPQGPAFVVKNPAAEAREELVCASLPLPFGRFDALAAVGVDGRRAPTRPLLRWPDGSLAVVQVQAVVRLAAGERRRIEVDTSPGEAPEALPGAWYFQGEIPLHTELEDPWGTVYRARLVPDPTAGRGGVLSQTSRVRTRRYRSVHRAGKRRFFGLVAYLKTVKGERRSELTLMLDNQSRGSGAVLGPARFRRLSVVIESEHLKVRPRFISENGLRPPQRIDGHWRQDLVGPSDQIYLGDHTAKTWRLDLFLDGEGVTPKQRRAARLATDFRLRAIPDLQWTRHTRAFGAHGGPAPGPGVAKAASVWMRYDWRSRAGFGPFGGFGDVKDAAVNGTLRNGPCSLHNAIRYGSGPLLRVAEAMVLQQSLRPTPTLATRVPEATVLLRQGMSKRSLQMPHGFTALDYEHFSVDLLYDYYWMTGDAFARDEMARQGRGLRLILNDLPFFTCRGEGWCMQAAVLISRAQGDQKLVSWVHERFKKRIEPRLGRGRAPFVLKQPPHEDALDGQVEFDCPWQMAAFVHGAHAMYVQTGDARYQTAGVRAGRVMANAGWVVGKGPKYLLSAVDAGRYSMPVGFAPLEGTALMQVGAFVLALEMASKQDDRDLYRRRAATLVAPYRSIERSRSAMNPWFQLYLDRLASDFGGAVKGDGK